MRISIQRAAFASTLAMIALGSAEVAARVDDWIRLGIPFARTPDYDHDLKYRDWFGVRGKPNGRYRQWKLNNFGFRGPDIQRAPPAGCTRVMVLGASESFGLYEGPDHEYPAQLRDSLRDRGSCYEVVNSAIVGAGLQGLIRLWENYSSQFHPSVVVIYPSPAFYLGNSAPVWGPMPGKAQPEGELPLRPRLIEQLHNVWETPDFLQRRRLASWMAHDTAGKPADWFFRTPPKERLDAFSRDLDSLVKSIRASGATPILMTHAMRFSAPLRPDDEVLLMGWERFTPRVTTDALFGFEAAAANWMREYAMQQHLGLIDVDRALTGKRDSFADGVHFTSQGAGVVAELITQQLVGSHARSAAGTTASSPSKR